MKLYLSVILASATIFGFTLACTTPEQKQSTTKVVAGSTALAPQEKAWKDMEREERVTYMRTVVLPRMRQLFAEFNPEEFPRINCKTCHGDGATNESFEMPNPKLPKLPSTTEGFQELMKKDSAAMVFMMRKVKPEMAKLLGMPPSDPQTQPDGFGCGNCHTFKK
jgi:hypothetical protein